MAEMHHATPDARRRLALHIAIATIAGVAIIALSHRYQPALLEWVAIDPSETRRRAQLIVTAAGVILLAPLLGFALYVWRLGSRTIREARFPPEGLPVIRDVLVVRGDAARGRGRVLRGIGAMLGMLTAAMALVLWWLATLPARP